MANLLARTRTIITLKECLITIIGIKQIKIVFVRDITIDILIRNRRLFTGIIILTIKLMIFLLSWTTVFARASSSIYRAPNSVSDTGVYYCGTATFFAGQQPSRGNFPLNMGGGPNVSNQGYKF